MLSGNDLQFIRTAQLDAMPDIGSLRTPTFTTVNGVSTEGASVDITGVPYRLMFTSGSERAAGGTVTPERQYMLTIPNTYTLTPKMRFVDKAGVVYEVISVNAGVSWLSATRATLMRVDLS